MKRVLLINPLIVSIFTLVACYIIFKTELVAPKKSFLSFI